jgi:basic membrane protein A and related proteins
MRLTASIGASLALGAMLVASAAVSAQDPAASPEPAATPIPQSPGTQVAVVILGRSNDLGANQAVTAGAKQGVAKIGAPAPKVEELDGSGDVAKLFRKLADNGAIAIVTGPGLDEETAWAAQANTFVRFIGVDQAPPCLTPEGLADTSDRCEGDAGALIPNLTILQYAEDQAGYLAGIAAASMSPNGRVAAIGGISTCASCVRYLQGFELGARSVDPDIEVAIAHVTDTDEQVGFDDAATGRAFARAFIDVFQPDVLMAGTGATGRGVIDAACEAGILAIGVDIDQASAHPRAASCILTSAKKSLARSVESSVVGIAADATRGGIDRWDASRGGVGWEPFRDELDAQVPFGLDRQLDDALAAIARGSVQTCPEDCGTPD